MSEASRFKRVALGPEHSLTHWIRYVQTLADPAGNGGRMVPVTPEMLKQHCSEDDLWVHLNGKVYNVTEYLPFHPGGKESLLSVAGGDATKLFNEYHPWVNFDAMLPRCCVGPYHGPRFQK